jgi:hypothetical protein
MRRLYTIQHENGKYVSRDIFDLIYDTVRLGGVPLVERIEDAWQSDDFDKPEIPGDHPAFAGLKIIPVPAPAPWRTK